MGITRGTARLLVKTLKDADRKESIITLGVMAIHLTEEDLKQICQEEGFPFNPQSISAQCTGAHRHLTDHSFFKLLGFTSIRALDYSDYEGADIIMDLNQPNPPSQVEKADVVLDSGTLEHIFHIPNALGTINRLVKESGIIIHNNPANCMIDHGFYQLSPTLFADFYLENNAKILGMALQFSNFHAVNYETDLYRNPNRPFSTKKAMAYTAVQKQSHTPDIKMPIQGYYRQTYSGNTNNQVPTSLDLSFDRRGQHFRQLATRLIRPRYFTRYLKKLLRTIS